VVSLTQQVCRSDRGVVCMLVDFDGLCMGGDGTLLRSSIWLTVNGDWYVDREH
jgi:hypothetical protein